MGKVKGKWVDIKGKGEGEGKGDEKDANVIHVCNTFGMILSSKLVSLKNKLMSIL